MSNTKTTFLDFPLEKELYKAKLSQPEKPPLRILLTEGGSKCAYCLIYKICRGEVFGPDQKVIIHLVNAKGVVDHKSIFFELEECGFELLEGWLVTASTEEAYKDVDIVVSLLNMEEQSGISFKETIVGLIIKARHIVKFVSETGKPDVKLVLAGPSTKTALLLLNIMHRFEPRVPIVNMSAVTMLDEAVARANLAARLKTQTHKIKNIVVWGMTCPDVCHSTVKMLPMGDLGALEEEDIPVEEALQDDNYLNDEFIDLLFKRKVGTEIIRSGKSLAVATARHLKVLHLGTDKDEIFSMGVITPSWEPFAVPAGLPFSYPVTVKNGTWTIRQDLKYNVRTYLNMIRTVDRLLTDKTLVSMYKAVDYILKFEESQNDIIRIHQKQELTKMLVACGWDIKFFLAALPEEAIPQNVSVLKLRKSILWDDHKSEKYRSSSECHRKSSIRFNSDEGFRKERAGSILRNQSDKTVFLPPIEPGKRY